MSAPDFWDNREKAQKLSSEANHVRNRIDAFTGLERRIGDLALLADMAREEGTDQALAEFQGEFESAVRDFDALELQCLLRGETDPNNAIINLHAGAGGTEACDWANILYRMYNRWAERNGFKWEVLDAQAGDEAGLKSATVMVRGEFAYGKLKSENGVHRLVRISPFDSNARRHTSFCALDVLAEIDENIEIEVLDKDIRVDVFRSGGCGGQGVNTTDSAVRITHFPSGLVVVCQNERSQIKNKASALKVLKSRLYEVEMDKRRAEQERHYSEKGEIGWGRQIRSYVLQPYQMVKDLRTGEQTSDVNGVLDGELNDFMNAFLKGKKRTDTDDDDDV